MMRMLETGFFAVLALGLHVLAGWIVPQGGGDAAGAMGSSAVSVLGVDSTLSELVADWDSPPDVAVPDAPDTPAAQTETALIQPEKAPAIAPMLPLPESISSPLVPPQSFTRPEPAKPPQVSGAPREPDPGVVAFTAATPPEPAEQPDGLQRVSITKTPENPIEPDFVAPQTHTPVSKRPMPRPAASVPDMVAAGRAETQPGVVSGNDGAAAQRDTSAVQARQMRAVWGNDIMRAVSRATRFPQAARARGLEGRAVVSVTLAANGQLEAVSLVQSTGASLLDEAALAAIRRVGRFPAAPGDFRAARETFRLPLNFNLN